VQCVTAIPCKCTKDLLENKVISVCTYRVPLSNDMASINGAEQLCMTDLLKSLYKVLVSEVSNPRKSYCKCELKMGENMNYSNWERWKTLNRNKI